MRVFDARDMVKGWFVGDFPESAYRTKVVEVAYKVHRQREYWAKHYHRVAIEVNYLIRGRMIVNGRSLKSGDIFVVNPNETAEPEFLEDCELIVVKIPSVVGDKYESV